MAEDNSGSGKTVGFALVGTGMIAGFHARALADVPEARLVAVVSRDTAKARAFLDKQPNGRNAFATASLAEALARPGTFNTRMSTLSPNLLFLKTYTLRSR